MSGERIDLLAALNDALWRAREDRKGIAHDHPEFVSGCFRCDLSRDELGAGA